MKVEQNKMVGVDYKLTVDGQIADQSRPGQPLEFIFGTGMLLPKFEEAILGKEVGEAVSFTLEPKDGYGELIADAMEKVGKDGVITVDVIIMVRYGSNVVSVAKQVQDTVTGAVESMTGMGAPVVNVHVSGVAFDK